jgi:SAM-dependent methyltransferase
VTGLDRYAERYAALYDSEAFETVLVAIRRRHVLGWVRRVGARRILEVGCGLEPLFAHYADFDVWRVVEPIATFAERARDLRGDDPRVEVRCGRLEELTGPLAEETFDLIVVSGLLHEVDDPAPLLAAVRSLCAEATVAHFNVPNALSFHRLLAMEMGLIEDVFAPSAMDVAFERPRRFDRDRLIGLLEGADFTALESGTYFVKPFTHDQMDAMLRTGAFPDSVIEGLDRMIKYMPEHGCELYANARKA